MTPSPVSDPRDPKRRIVRLAVIDGVVIAAAVAAYVYTGNYVWLIAGVGASMLIIAPALFAVQRDMMAQRKRGAREE